MPIFFKVNFARFILSFFHLSTQYTIVFTFFFLALIMDFNTLLQQAQKLANETQNTEDLPRVERTLPQVLQASEELHSRVKQTGAQDVNALVL